MKKDTRKKPRALKILSGNAGKRKLKPEPKFSPVNETPPDDLDSIGQAEWMRIAPELREQGVLTICDEAILFAYCDEFSLAKRCAKKINEQGLMIKRTPRSKVLTVNPYLTLKQKSFAILKSLACELGLTPCSRSKVSIVPTKPDDDKYAQLKKQREASLIAAQERFKNQQSKRKKNPADDFPLPTG